MEKESKTESRLIDLIKDQLENDVEQLIEFLDFKKNNEEIIKDLIEHNILNFGDSQNYDEKNC